MLHTSLLASATSKEKYTTWTVKLFDFFKYTTRANLRYQYCDATNELVTGRFHWNTDPKQARATKDEANLTATAMNPLNEGRYTVVDT